MLDVSNRDRQAERREATRREIVAAAWEFAHERGLTEWTLRDVATRVGMRAPSVYFHFANKNAIYDAMFGAAWTEFGRIVAETAFPVEPRAHSRARAHAFFDFAVADPARYQLMNQRAVPGFEPSPESFAPSVRVVTEAMDAVTAMGVGDRDDLEIFFALIGGLVSQQLANDPGGDSRRRLIDRAVNMWADAVGLPPDR